jgi:hypothetical protein
MIAKDGALADIRSVNPPVFLEWIFKRTSDPLFGVLADRRGRFGRNSVSYVRDDAKNRRFAANNVPDVRVTQMSRLCAACQYRFV